MLRRLFLAAAVALGARRGCVGPRRGTKPTIVRRHGGGPATRRRSPVLRPSSRRPRRRWPASPTPDRSCRPPARSRCPTTPARSGATTTSAPTRRGSRARSGPNKPSSTGFSARRATRRGTPSRWASSAPATARFASTTRPKCRSIVADVVERFTSSEAATYTFSMRVVTLDSPKLADCGPAALAAGAGANAGHQRLAAAQGKRRHPVGRTSPPQRLPRTQFAVPDGQQRAIDRRFGHARPALRPRRNPAARHGRRLRSVPGQVDEGFAFDFSPLLSVDRRMIDATIKCEIDQVEKMIPVVIDVPTPILPRQRTKIEVAADVALSLPRAFPLADRSGVGGGAGHGGAADPGRRRPAGAGRAAADRQLAARADLLVFIECKGPSTPVANTPAGTQPPFREAKNYRGRY